MTREEIKRQTGRGAFDRSKTRPKGAPMEILYLSDEVLSTCPCRLKCEDETFLSVPDGFKKVGGYGVKNTKKGWMRLVRNNSGNYEWVYETNFKRIRKWSRMLQKELEIQETKYKRPSPSQKLSFENKLGLDNQYMILLLTVNGDKQKLKAELTGKFIEPVEGFKNATKYLKHLVKEYGQDAVKYEYSFQ